MRERVTQIMNLLRLAPEIQLEILCWLRVTRNTPISQLRQSVD